MPSTEIKAAMSCFEYFKKFDEDAITQCCNLAKIKKYSKDKIVLGDSVGFPYYVYFVVTGECRIIEELYVFKHKSKKYTRYKLYIQPETTNVHVTNQTNTNSKILNNLQTMASNELQIPTVENNLSMNVEVHFVQVCIFSPLSCFGFGEHMERRRVITTTATECLLIPLYWLMQKNINNIWNRIQIFQKKFVPTTEQVFREFVSQRLWNKHRQKLTQSIVFKEKRSSGNYFYNVPYYIRINEIT